MSHARRAGFGAASLVLAFVVVHPALVTPAGAQQVEVGSFAGPADGPFGSMISSKSVARYGQLLGLTEDQEAAVKELHSGYTAEFRDTSVKMREAMSAMQEKARGDGGFHVFPEDMPKLMAEFGAKRQQLEEGFLGDIKFLLGPEQQDRWPAIERLRRRETALRRGVVSGEGVDLIGVVEALKLGAPVMETLAPTLGQYELDLDRVLQDRIKVEREMRGGVPGTVMFIPETMQERMKALREAGAQIRDVNERYARLIASLLPEQDRPAFADKVERLSFPQVYRTSYTARQVSAASKFHDLLPEQKRSIDQIRSSYEREAVELNRRWARAVRKAEESGSGGGVFMHAGPDGGDVVTVSRFGGESDDVREARQARQELDGRVAERLAALLNEDQKGRLPKEQDSRRQISRLHGADGDMAVEFVVIEDEEGAADEEEGDGPP